MAYNEELDARVTAEVAGWGTTRKKMFGGTAHILNGNLLCGVHKKLSDTAPRRTGRRRGAEESARHAV